jgi:uncharacterized OsmC-like protein
MADIESHTVNEEQYFASSRVGDFELSIDSTGEDGPTPNETLVAAYASCYTAAFRAGGQRVHDVDVGRLEIEAEASLDEDDDLADIAFTLHVEADLDDELAEAMVETGDDICHVHAAVREGLHADVDVVADAF